MEANEPNMYTSSFFRFPNVSYVLMCFVHVFEWTSGQWNWNVRLVRSAQDSTSKKKTPALQWKTSDSVNTPISVLIPNYTYHVIYIYYHYLKNILYMISCLNLGVCLQNEDKWSLRCFSLGQTWGSDKSQTSTNFSEAAFDGRALLLGSQPDGRGDGLTVIHSWSCWTFGLCRIFKHFHFVRLMNLTIHWCTGFRICHFSSIYLVVVQPSLTALAVQICQLSMATSPWIGYNGCGNMWQLCPVNSPPPPCSWCSGAAADGNVELPAGNGGCQDRGQRGGRICYLDDSRKSLVGGVVHISEFPNIYNMLKYGY